MGHNVISSEFGDQLWPNLLQFDETHILRIGEDQQLDLIRLPVSDNMMVHAVLQE